MSTFYFFETFCVRLHQKEISTNFFLTGDSSQTKKIFSYIRRHHRHRRHRRHHPQTRSVTVRLWVAERSGWFWYSGGLTANTELREKYTGGSQSQFRLEKTPGELDLIELFPGGLPHRAPIEEQHDMAMFIH